MSAASEKIERHYKRKREESRQLRLQRVEKILKVFGLKVDEPFAVPRVLGVNQARKVREYLNLARSLGMDTTVHVAPDNPAWGPRPAAWIEYDGTFELCARILPQHPQNTANNGNSVGEIEDDKSA